MARCLLLRGALGPSDKSGAALAQSGSIGSAGILCIPPSEHPRLEKKGLPSPLVPLGGGEGGTAMLGSTAG